MGSNQYWAGRVYDLCVYYMTGSPEGSTESGFMEKPGPLVGIGGSRGVHEGGFALLCPPPPVFKYPMKMK